MNGDPSNFTTREEIERTFPELARWPDMAQMDDATDDADWSVVGIVVWAAILCLALGAAIAAVVL
jgi:hypothetical protein